MRIWLRAEWVRRLGLAFWLAAFGIAGSGLAQAEDATLSLAGEWRFRADPNEVGIREQWFRDTFDETVTLPGSMAENGKGNPVTAETDWTGTVVSRMWHEEERFAKYRDPENTKIMFWLQPEHHYVGAAWYQRTLEVPEAFRGKRVMLRLERCHWETQVWVDDTAIDMANSLCVPHEYDLSGARTPEALTPGEHTITIRVDNSLKIDVGENAHSVSDNTQSNWNGIVGALSLVARDRVWVQDVQVYPELATNTAKVAVTIGNATGQRVDTVVKLYADSSNTSHDHVVPGIERALTLDGREGQLEVDYELGDSALHWSEFSPAVYKLTVAVDATADGQACSDMCVVDFGMREFGIDGTRFTLNGNPIFLRGTLECCIFPLTGYPPTDVGSWMKVLTAAKAHGLNHLRFHSWCPPEAAFDAADRMGFIFQVEGPAWARVGDGEAVDEFVYAECDRILEAYGNHPSFCLMAYGNEPAGKNQKDYLAKLVDHLKAKDPRHVYTSASGWPVLPENEFHVTPKPRAHAWGSGLKSRFNARAFDTRTHYEGFVAQYDVPVISHEIGQWCVYPNLKETAKYTGPLKARNFDIFREMLDANGMLDQADDFLMASGKLQALCYKEEIEAALRTKGFGGFQLLDLHDFPGQGTALVGVLDPFWESKGYVSAEEFRRFCGPTVPLLRMDKCVWTTNETFEADVQVTHFGAGPLENVRPLWRVTDVAGNVVASGELEETTIPFGSAIPIGHISGPVATLLGNLNAPRQLVVTVELADTPYANSWNIWVYGPAEAKDDTEPADGIHVAEALDEAAREVLEGGGKVLLLPAAGTVRGDARGKVPAGFSPIFWNTFWTKGQPPHTLGILCDPEHPALAAFPTEFHSNWQWWEVVHGSQIMILDGLPRELRPIVQVIDDWTTNRRLGLVFEARVARGKVLVCGANLVDDLENRAVARQLRWSLLAYMASDAFAPDVELGAAVLGGLFEPPSAVRRLGATARADSEQTAHEATLTLDGDPSTIWHTAWEPKVAEYPHWIQIDLKESLAVKGLSFLPRQDMANGRIGRYAIYVSDKPDRRRKPVVKGHFRGDGELKRITFRKAIKGRYVRIEALEPANPKHPWASLAELDVIIEEDGG